MSCVGETCCLTTCDTSCCNTEDITKTTDKFFGAGVSPSVYKFKTGFKPYHKKLDLCVTHHPDTSKSSWDLSAKGSVSKNVDLSAKLTDLYMLEDKLTLSHPKLQDTYLDIGGAINIKDRTYTPKCSVTKKFEMGKVTAGLSYLPCVKSEEEKPVCCIMSRTKYELSALLNHQKITAGFGLKGTGVKEPKDFCHCYAAKYRDGNLTLTASSSCFKNIKSSALYKIDKSLTLGAQLVYCVSDKSVHSKVGFAKKLKHSGLLTAILGSDYSAMVSVKHKVDDHVSFTINHSLSLKGGEAPTKFGFGLDLNL